MSRRIKVSAFAQNLVVQVQVATERSAAWTQDDDPEKLARRRRRVTNQLLRYIAHLELAAGHGGTPE